MQISLTEVNNTSSYLVFPSLPEKIQMKKSARHHSYEIIETGTVKIPKGTETGTISWSGTFLVLPRKKESVVLTDYWKSPQDCVKTLENWRDKGTVLNLVVSDKSVNCSVTIQTFDYESTGAFGNYDYTISFIQNRDLKIYTTSELKITAYKPATTRAATTGGTYTVVSGDTLWGIAQKKLGQATRWPEIYNLNKDIIEASAKRHGKSSSSNGHWIYPGDTYTLPVK